MMVITRKRSRHLIGFLKDDISFFKARFFLSKRKSAFRVAILRATSHRRSSETNINSLLLSSDDTKATTVRDVACIEAATMNRLCKTRNAYVALKCLVILHRIILTHGRLFATTKGFGGGRNFPNLSDFCDDESDADTAMEISKWVRWYACVLEQHLITRRDLDQMIMMISDQTNKEHTNSLLVKELESLVTFVEQVSASPSSYHLQKYDVVHEVVKSTGEDYAMVQREILCRVKEMNGRIDGFRATELTRSINALERLENCKENLVLLVVTRRRNQDLWDLIGTCKDKVVTTVNAKKGKQNAI